MPRHRKFAMPNCPDTGENTGRAVMPHVPPSGSK